MEAKSLDVSIKSISASVQTIEFIMENHNINNNTKVLLSKVIDIQNLIYENLLNHI